MSRRRVAELDTPFSSVEWPSISQEDQDSILELLCSLLEPIGQHRRNHVVPSEGKRSRQKAKAANKNGQHKTEDVTIKDSTPSVSATPAAPPPPELARFVDVGLVSITRELAGQAQQTQNQQSQQAQPQQSTAEAEAVVAASATATANDQTAKEQSPYVAVFIVRSGHPAAFYSHLPQMVAVSSTPPLLVGFSRPCEERLSAVLGVPRVSSIGLRANAPQSQGLVSYLREKVAPVRVAWLDEAASGQFRETNIHVADVKVGPKRKKQ